MIASPVEQETNFKKLKKNISLFFEWLATIVIFVLFVASVIVATDATMPVIANLDIKLFGLDLRLGHWIGDIALFALNISVEAAMVGCTVLAKKAKGQGETLTQVKYNCFGYGFFVLFILTMIFQVVKPAEPGPTILLCIRAGAGVLYSFMCHGDDDTHGTVKAVRDEIAVKVLSLETQIKQFFSSEVNQYRTELNTIRTELRTVSELFTELTELQTEQNRTPNRTFSELPNELFRTVSELLDGRIEQLESSFRTNLYSVSEQLQLANSEHLRMIENRFLLESGKSATTDIDDMLRTIEEGLNQRFEEGTKLLTSHVKGTLDTAIRTIQSFNVPSTPPVPQSFTQNKPKIALPQRTEQRSKTNVEADKGITKKEFVAKCLKENPNAQNKDILQMAMNQNFNLPKSTLSEILAELRKNIIEVDTQYNLMAVH